VSAVPALGNGCGELRIVVCADKLSPIARKPPDIGRIDPSDIRLERERPLKIGMRKTFGPENSSPMVGVLVSNESGI
jgi:hypothetical protein